VVLDVLHHRDAHKYILLQNLYARSGLQHQS
jgi:hypothetical protein